MRGCHIVNGREGGCVRECHSAEGVYARMLRGC